MKRLLTAGSVCVLALTLRIGARRIPGFADAYAQRTNAFWVNTLGRLFDLVPFSAVELLIVLILAGVLSFLVHLAVRAIRKTEGTGAFLRKGLGRAALLASVIFLLFEAGADVYFYCPPFSARCGFGAGSYSTEELLLVCTELAGTCNALAPSVSRDERGLMLPEADLRGRIAREMEALGEEYPMLAGWCPRPKGVALSFVMSYTDLAGIYSAYTREANYNRDMAPYNFAFTMSHELSHVKGVLPENEANFTAFLNCMKSADADIRYSGALLGWIYCGNELYKRDYDAWYELAVGLDPAVSGDLAWNMAFWQRHKGKVQEASNQFNDSYLKAHGQTEGRESYDRVVDLIVSSREAWEQDS